MVNHNFAMQSWWYFNHKSHGKTLSIFCSSPPLDLQVSECSTSPKIYQLQRIFMVHVVHLSLVKSPNSQPRTHASASHDNCQVEQCCSPGHPVSSCALNHSLAIKSFKHFMQESRNEIITNECHWLFISAKT